MLLGPEPNDAGDRSPSHQKEAVAISQFPIPTQCDCACQIRHILNNNIPTIRHAQVQNASSPAACPLPSQEVLVVANPAHSLNKMHALAIALVPLLAQLVSTQSTLPTTLHFFPRTSCNTGTSLSYTTVADLYSDSTCHTTPVGTEALYIDGIAEGCAGKPARNCTCTQHQY